jgi:hypothetical protein
VNNHPLEINVRAFLRIEKAFARLHLVNYGDGLVVQHMMCDKLRHVRVGRVHIRLTIEAAIFNGNVYHYFILISI